MMHSQLLAMYHVLPAPARSVRVVVEQVAEIPRTANGKLRAVTCERPAEERRALLRERSAVPA